MNESFRIISVRGNSVRVRTGSLTVDLKVLELPGGKKYVRKPRDVYIEPGVFLKVVGAVIQAHKESLSVPGG